MGAAPRLTIDLGPVLATYTSRLAGPPCFDFGTLHPGALRTLALDLRNLTPHPARTIVRYDGSPGIHLRSAPAQLAANSTHPLVLSVVAPTPVTPLRGSLWIEAHWRREVEIIAIPVLAHADLDPDLTLHDALPFRSRHARDAMRARQIADVEAQLAHVTISNPTFDAQLANTAHAMYLLGTQQQLGIDRAARELLAHTRTAPWLDLAMTALDLASTRVATQVAQTIEAGLHDLAAASDPAKPLGEGTRLAITNAVRRGLAVGATRKTHRRPPTSDPRLAFLELVRIGNSMHEHERQASLRHAAALLRPTLRASSALAVGALRVIERALRAEGGHASVAYCEATTRQWLGFLHAR